MENSLHEQIEIEYQSNRPPESASMTLRREWSHVIFMLPDENGQDRIVHQMPLDAFHALFNRALGIWPSKEDGSDE